jgi:hypothetical protein
LAFTHANQLENGLEDVSLLFFRNVSTRLFQYIFQVDTHPVSDTEDCFKRRVAEFTFHVADGLLSQPALRGQGIFGNAAPLPLGTEELDHLHTNCPLFGT